MTLARIESGFLAKYSSKISFSILICNVNLKKKQDLKWFITGVNQYVVDLILPSNLGRCYFDLCEIFADFSQPANKNRLNPDSEWLI